MRVLSALVAVVAATFNYSKCPSYHEMQAPHMKDFDIQGLVGNYYEVAFHDYTQFPTCPDKPRCITSDKRIQKHKDGVVFVNDTWNLFCFGHYWPQELLFNVTSTPGFLMGYVDRSPSLPINPLKGMKFPDTLVDFRPGPRGWALEFQCKEALGGVKFIGINFYAKSLAHEVYEEMLEAAEKSGIDFYYKHGLGLKLVNHTGCPPAPTPPMPTPATMPFQQQQQQQQQEAPCEAQKCEYDHECHPWTADCNDCIWPGGDWTKGYCGNKDNEAQGPLHDDEISFQHEDFSFFGTDFSFFGTEQQQEAPPSMSRKLRDDEATPPSIQESTAPVGCPPGSVEYCGEWSCIRSMEPLVRNKGTVAPCSAECPGYVNCCCKVPPGGQEQSEAENAVAMRAKNEVGKELIV